MKQHRQAAAARQIGICKRSRIQGH